MYLPARKHRHSTLTPTPEHRLCKTPTMSGVALDHLIVGFEARGGDVGHGEALVGGLVCTQHRRVRHQGEVDPVITRVRKEALDTSSHLGRFYSCSPVS